MFNAYVPIILTNLYTCLSEPTLHHFLSTALYLSSHKSVSNARGQYAKSSYKSANQGQYKYVDLFVCVCVLEYFFETSLVKALLLIFPCPPAPSAGDWEQCWISADIQERDQRSSPGQCAFPQHTYTIRRRYIGQHPRMIKVITLSTHTGQVKGRRNRGNLGGKYWDRVLWHNYILFVDCYLFGKWINLFTFETQSCMPIA